ncbi:hypothetical protein, partial [Zooshikella harenae]
KIPIWPILKPKKLEKNHKSDLLKPIFFNQLVSPENRTPRTLDLEITKKDSQKLILFCKKNNITVTQLFSALFVKSFCITINLNKTNLYTAVSLRSKQFTSKPVLHMGCNITVVKTVPLDVNESILSLARDCGQQLDQAIHHWHPVSTTHTDIRKHVKSFAKASKSAGIAITNVGNLSDSDFKGGIKPLAFRTVVNRIGANYAVVLHLMSLNNHLRAVLSFSDPVISFHKMEIMKAKFKSLVNECCNGVINL